MAHLDARPGEGDPWRRPRHHSDKPRVRTRPGGLPKSSEVWVRHLRPGSAGGVRGKLIASKEESGGEEKEERAQRAEQIPHVMPPMAARRRICPGCKAFGLRYAAARQPGRKTRMPASSLAHRAHRIFTCANATEPYICRNGVPKVGAGDTVAMVGNRCLKVPLLRLSLRSSPDSSRWSAQAGHPENTVSSCMLRRKPCHIPRQPIII